MEVWEIEQKSIVQQFSRLNQREVDGNRTEEISSGSVIENNIGESQQNAPETISEVSQNIYDFIDSQTSISRSKLMKEFQASDIEAERMLEKLQELRLIGPKNEMVSFLG